MKIIDQIFKKNRPEFKAFQQLKTDIAAATKKRNDIAHFSASLETKVNKLTAELFAETSVEAFQKLVAAYAERDAATKVLSETFSSLSICAASELTDSDEGCDILGAALFAYADELDKVIKQISADSQALAERLGITYSEPPSLETLRTEALKAREGVTICRSDDVRSPWPSYSGLIRIEASAA